MQIDAPGLALQPDGRILVGAVLTGSATYWLGAVSLMPSGARDTTFETPTLGCGPRNTGVAMAQQLSEQTFGVAVQFDGRIVVGGSRNVFDQVVLTRFLPTGAVDSSFGGSGFATAPLPSHVIEEYGRALLLQPDGKLVVAGAVQRPNFGTAFREGVHLARYHGDGTVDTSFGTGGRVETWIPGRGMRADAVALDPSGRIIVAGCIEQGGPSFGQCKFSGPSTATNFFTARYSPTGVLDPTFGSTFAGIDVAGYWDAAAGIAVQSDGRIVAAGGASLDGNTQQHFALVRVFGGTVNCTATLLPASRSTGQAGSFGTIEVGLPPGCPWTATSNVPWMVVTAGSSGAGNGVVTYVFQENTTTAQRIGTLSVAGVSFALTQGPAMAPALSTQPVEQTVAPGGQATFVSLATGDPPPTYRWQMSADGSSWSDVPAIPPYYGANGRTLAIVPVPGSLTGFRFQVTASNSAGVVTSVAAALTVTAAPPCNYSVSPIDVVVPAAGASGGIDLTTGPTCAWSASVTETWLLVTPTSGTGSRRVSFSIAMSSLATERTATLTIGGRVVGFRQIASAITAPVLAPAVVLRPNVSFSWTPPTAGPPPTSYTLEASLTPGGPPVASLPLGAERSLTVAAPDGTFYVRIIATVNGSPAPSNEIQVVVAPPSIPAAPQGFSAGVAGSVITFAWQAPGGSAVTGYVLEAGSGPGLSNLAILPLGNVTTFVTPPVPNGSYYVRVRGQNTSGTGPPSNEVRVVVGPPPPSAPTLTGAGSLGGNVVLSWSTPSSGAAVTGYELHAGTAPGLSNIVVNPTAGVAGDARGRWRAARHVRRARRGNQRPGSRGVVQRGCARSALASEPRQGRSAAEHVVVHRRPSPCPCSCSAGYGWKHPTSDQTGRAAGARRRQRRDGAVPEDRPRAGQCRVGADQRQPGVPGHLAERHDDAAAAAAPPLRRPGDDDTRPPPRAAACWPAAHSVPPRR